MPRMLDGEQEVRMRVLACPRCGVLPDIGRMRFGPYVVRCPKCGHAAVGPQMKVAVTRWNDWELWGFRRFLETDWSDDGR